MPTVALVDKEGEERQVCTGRLKSYYITTNGAHLHLHPELVGQHDDGEDYMNLCKTCARATIKGEDTAPPQTIAAGRDFGLFSRIDVDTPNAMEEMILANVRTYSLVAKVHITNTRTTAATRSLLHGHMIAFVHDGPQIITQYLNEAHLNSLLDHIQVVFVGDKGRQTQLERKTLRSYPGLQLRPHVLYNHLAIRQALGHSPQTKLPALEEIASLVSDWADKLLARARLVRDDAVEKASKPSDVANVRDVAMDDEHAAELNRDFQQKTGEDERMPEVQLDPVGVFMQGVGVLAAASSMVSKTCCAAQEKPTRARSKRTMKQQYKHHQTGRLM